MKLKRGNYLEKVAIDNTIEHFQKIAYQIIYGTYVDPKYKKEHIVHNQLELEKDYGKQISIHYAYNVMYYRICSTESTIIVQFLNSQLELVCGVETIPEKNYFKVS